MFNLWIMTNSQRDELAETIALNFKVAKSALEMSINVADENDDKDAKEKAFDALTSLAIKTFQTLSNLLGARAFKRFITQQNLAEIKELNKNL